jgi:hypothetical protein
MDRIGSQNTIPGGKYRYEITDVKLDPKDVDEFPVDIVNPVFGNGCEVGVLFVFIPLQESSSGQNQFDLSMGRTFADV